MIISSFDDDVTIKNAITFFSDFFFRTKLFTIKTYELGFSKNENFVGVDFTKN